MMSFRKNHIVFVKAKNAFLRVFENSIHKQLKTQPWPNNYFNTFECIFIN